MAVAGSMVNFLGAKPRTATTSPVARALADTTPFAGTPSDASSTGGYGPGTPTPPPVAPSAPAPAPTDTGDGGGGDSNPFLTDPTYLAALAAQQANSQQLDNALRAARESAVVGFGDPNLVVPGWQVDPVTAAAAAANTAAGNSTLAQLQRTRDQNQQSIVNNLAAHGIIASGDLGYKTGQNQQDYGTNLYNAQQSVLSNLAAQLQANLAGKAGDQNSTVQALIAADNNYVNNPQFWGAADIAGQTSAANASATGQAAYPYTATPVTSALAKPSAPKAPASRLAASPIPMSSARLGRQVAY